MGWKTGLEAEGDDKPKIQEYVLRGRTALTSQAGRLIALFDKVIARD